MRARLIFLAGLIVAGCDQPLPLEQSPGVLARATEPRYQLRPDGRVAATSCLSGRPAGYGPAPAACVLDNAFAVQVANTSDLVAPRQPGPPYAAPAAAAAYDYLYGEGASGRPTLVVDPGGGGAGRIDIPEPGLPPADDAAPGVEPL